MIFKDGSYANGGAMRIGPIGIVFRNATNLELRAAVTEAVKSTHVNLEAIDGAFLIAKAITLLLKYSPPSFNPIEFLSNLESITEQPKIKEKLVEITKHKDRFSVEPIKDAASGGWYHFSTKDAWKIDDLLLNSVSGLKFPVSFGICLREGQCSWSGHDRTNIFDQSVSAARPTFD